jgi:hypothetical protein
MIEAATVTWLAVAPAAVPLGQLLALVAPLVVGAPTAAALVVGPLVVVGVACPPPDDEQPTTIDAAAMGATIDLATVRHNEDLTGADCFTGFLLGWTRR